MGKCFVVTLGMLFLALSINAQDESHFTVLDSLEEKVSTSHGKSKGEALLELSRHQAIKGLNYAGIKNAEKSHFIFKRYHDQRNLIKAKMMLAYFYTKLADYPNSLDHSSEAESLSIELGDSILTHKAKMRVASVYIRLERFDKANNKLNEALEIATLLNDSHLIAQTYSELATIYEGDDQTQESIDAYQKALKILNPEEFSIQYAAICNNLGLIYSDIGEYSEAILYFNKVIEMEHLIGRSNVIIQAFHNIGRMHWLMEEYDKSLLYLDSTENLCIRHGYDLERCRTYYGKSFLYESMGDFQKALLYRKKYDSLHDSIFGKEKQDQIAQIELRQKIKEDDIKKELVRKETNQKIILLFGSIFLLTLTVIILVQRIRKDKMKLLLYEQEKNNIINNLDSKNRELVSMSMSLKQSRQVLGDIDLFLLKLSGNAQDPKIKDLISEHRGMIKTSEYFKNNWEMFKTHFEEVHPDFFSKLKDLHPNLTSKDLVHCAYIKIQLQIKDIALLQNINEGSVKVQRYRIKRKLHLDKDTDLTNYIDSI